MPYKDKDKQRAAENAYTKRNRERYTRQARERRAETRAALAKHVIEKGCSVCGYNKCSRSLHFHHTNPKTKVAAVATMVNTNTSPGRVWKEVAKCIVLCANCHGELHHKEMK